MQYLVIYLVFINLIAFIAYRIDKKRSKKGIWRIKESTLLLFALIGGGIGSILGMQVYRHKTQKAKFKIGVPILIIVSVIMIWLIIKTLEL